MIDPPAWTAAPTFGEVLRQHHIAADITQEALTKRAQMSARASYLEKDAYWPFHMRAFTEAQGKPADTEQIARS